MFQQFLLGVLGTTGIETSEIIKGIVDKTKPDFVIVIDALASKSLERIGKTIQISNTGINPGSGMGNKREGINKETLYIPVISIGIATVIDIATIVSEILGEKKDVDFNKMIQEGKNFFVTPKDIDEMISESSKILCNAINRALHK